MKQKNRWFHAAIGVFVLLFAGLIYAWSVLSRPIAAYFTDWTSAGLSLTFTICMMFFCLGGFVSGLLSEKINIKINLVISAFLFLGGFYIASRMNSLPALYLGYGVLAGTASGFAYNTVMGSVTKFFPDKPGLISGILLMGFGIGSFVIGKVYQAYTGSGEAFRTSLWTMGVIVFVVLLIGAVFIRKPSQEEMKAFAPRSEGNNQEGSEVSFGDMNPGQMVKRPSFWLYFIWSVLLSAAGLAVIAQAGGMVEEVSPTASAGVVSTAVGLISVFNGVGRVLFGGTYDKAGRVRTMIINEILYFTAVALMILSIVTGNFAVLVIGFIITGLAYGGVPTTNSAFVGDFYGKRNYGVNFPIMNMNLFVASFGSTIAGLLYDKSGSYLSTLIVLVCALAVGTVIAKRIKKP